MTDAETELKAIEKLHTTDMAASKSQDFTALRSLMSEEAVLMPPGGKTVCGKAALDAGFEEMKNETRQFEVLEYQQTFEEVTILGDYAFEWGEVKGAMRPKTGGETLRSSYKLMRILKRMPDGEWKVHRSIWNENPA